MTAVADRIVPVVRTLLGGRLPVRLRAWDGSEAGPPDGPVVILRHRRALRRLLWQPDELGLAQAYISGDLDVEGDLGTALGAAWRALRADGGPAGGGPARIGPSDALGALGTALRLGVIGPRPPAPGEPARLAGALHSKSRDRAAISHHYDLSNAFYALLLDPSMAYSCAYWTQDARQNGQAGQKPDYGLADAQRDKLELICRKLALRPGARLLDIGCGWGSLSLYAAEHHGAHVTAVTLAREQRDHVREQIQARSLTDRVTVELRDYRDLTQGPGQEPYDAVSTIEMGEHVGDAEYPGFAATLHRMLRPRGRALVQQMSRGANAPGGGAFIETYIAPDMHMRPLGETIGLLTGAGLEVRSAESLREHYVRTVAAWHRTLEERWDDVVAMVGPATARVWRLYLVGGALAFAERRMGVDQILAVRPGADGGSGMPATPHDWYATAGTGTAGGGSP
ncbi:class I SAM-dependent methyltransferase [Streptomyces sp. NPDC101393]|uniref:class I SAM-dependent methyltransferase n=1 Tax=Streptomyces sp. NPDC101393 TaxID=3366141 RepID=UPI00380BDFB5